VGGNSRALQARDARTALAHLGHRLEHIWSIGVSFQALKGQAFERSSAAPSLRGSCMALLHTTVSGNGHYQNAFHAARRDKQPNLGVLHGHLDDATPVVPRRRAEAVAVRLMASGSQHRIMSAISHRMARSLSVSAPTSSAT
jgi:hypothetical protein